MRVGDLHEFWKRDRAIATHYDQMKASTNRRNFILGVLNGAIFKITMLLIDSQTVLAWFLIQLGASNFAIGLITPIRMGSSFLLQILVSGYLQKRTHKLPFYRSMALIRCAALLGLSVVVAVTPLGSTWLVVLFFLMLTAYSMGSGLNGLAFSDIVAKVIPPRRRGGFYAQRSFWGGLLALAIGPIIGYMLAERSGVRFPLNVACLFAGAFVTQVVASGLWLFVKEPASRVADKAVNWVEQFKRGGQIFCENRAYRMYLIAQICGKLADTAGAFYVVYAEDALGITAEMVGVYLTARTAASIASNLLWGRVSDRAGNRRLLVIANLHGVWLPLLVLGIGALKNQMPASGVWLSWAYALVFVVSGSYAAASMIGRNGYVLDVAPPKERALYMGFSNTLQGLAQFLALASGLIVEWAGYPSLMIISVVFYSIALVCSLMMSEPRVIAGLVGAST